MTEEHTGPGGSLHDSILDIPVKITDELLEGHSVEADQIFAEVDFLFDGADPSLRCTVNTITRGKLISGHEEQVRRKSR